jgi:hypothetical protein
MSSGDHIKQEASSGGGLGRKPHQRVLADLTSTALIAKIQWLLAAPRAPLSPFCFVQVQGSVLAARTSNIYLPWCFAPYCLPRAEGLNKLDYICNDIVSSAFQGVADLADVQEAGCLLDNTSLLPFPVCKRGS